MNGDSAGSLCKTNCCGLYHAWSGSAPSVAQQRDFIKVHTEHGHVIHPKRRLTPQFSGRALPCEARREPIMKWRARAVAAPTYHGPLQLLVRRHGVGAQHVRRTHETLRVASELQARRESRT